MKPSKRNDKLVQLLGTAILLLFPFFSSHAVPMDAFVGVSALGSTGVVKPESGTRGGVRVEFARLNRWIEADLRAGFGNHYTDYGAFIRLYQHWRFNDESSSGLSLGVGVGALLSSGVTNGSFETGTLTAGGTKRPFTEFAANPFFRYIYDTKLGWGITAEVGGEVVPGRSYHSHPDGLAKKDSRTRTRIISTVGVAFEVD